MTTLFRVALILPIAIVYAVLAAGATETVYDQSGQVVSTTRGGIAAGLFLATSLMILFRQRYPRWWFDFVVGVGRWGLRVQAYAFLLVTDRSPPVLTPLRLFHTDGYRYSRSSSSRHR